MNINEMLASITDPALLAALEIRKAFPEAEAGFLEPAGEFGATFNGETVIAPLLDDVALLAAVRAIIAESKETGRNLFLERWERFEYDPDVQY